MTPSAAIDIGLLSQLGGGAILATVTAYFLRKVHSRVEDNAEKIGELKTDFKTLRVELRGDVIQMRDDIKEDIIEIFNDVCHERQAGCAARQDLKMIGVETRERAICIKLDKLEEARREAWREQKQWNEKVENRLNRTGGQK